MNTRILNGTWHVLVALVFSLSVIGFPTSHAFAAGPYTVNSLTDASDSTLGDGICFVTGVGCTLRAATQEANAGAGAETIYFSIDGTIALASGLPSISDDLTIDGSGRNVAISGADLYRVLVVNSGNTVNLKRLSIMDGFVSIGSGGGIYNEGILTVTDCTFSGNAANDGGGIENDGGTLTVSTSTFSENTSVVAGGGIDNEYGVVTVTNSTFSGNTGGNGGGISNYYGTLTVTNSTFSENTGGDGGGIYNDQGTLHLKNTILANSGGNGDCYSNTTPGSDINNLIESNNGCGTPVSSADPKLGPLAYNNGYTYSHSLLIGSPAIDAGDDTTCAAAPVGNFDQRGKTRPQGSHCDIGSYEKVPYTTYTVSNLSDSGTGSLRQAILDANTNYPIEDKIVFSVSGTISLGSSLPTIADDLFIDGSGQNVTIDGNHLYRVVHVNSRLSFTLNQVRMINGSAVGTTGGAIEGSSGDLFTITKSTFTGNSATWGGAITMQNGTLVVSDSTFTGNDGQYGGAIAVDYGTTRILNSTFYANQASDVGGAIRTYSYSAADTLTVANSTFTGNSATNGGGGIYHVDPGVLTVLNSTFSGNSSASGAGIRNQSGMLHLKNTILANSTSGGDCYSNVALTSDTNNLIENNNGCGTPISSADPMLRALTNNGGSTQTFSLQIGSPAIDTGDDSTCTASPVNNLDQRGAARIYGIHCDIGSFEAINQTDVLTLRSVGAHDGWILESGETTNVGGTKDSASTTFNLGDGAGDKQYRAVLSFNSAPLPDNAIITKVTLKIKRPGTGYLIGNNNPFTWGLGLKVDVRKPFFGTTAGLVISDFQAAAGKSAAATFGATPVSNWYRAVIGAAGYPYINKTGTTQFRLRFFKDDNNDGNADYMKFYSGNYAYAISRPTLVIEYYIP